MNRFSISEVSTRTGVSRAQISLIENGKADPRMSTVERLLSCYGTSLAGLDRVSRSIAADKVLDRARRAASRLESVGLGASDPDARLDARSSRGIDVAVERQALTTRR